MGKKHGDMDIYGEMVVHKEDAHFKQSVRIDQDLVVAGTTISLEVFNALPPVGMIVGWHKSMTGTPPLTEAWEECDGSPVANASSPYFGQNLPDLTDTRFLAGWYNSGEFGGSNFLLDHTHPGVDVVYPAHSVNVQTDWNDDTHAHSGSAEAPTGNISGKTVKVAESAEPTDDDVILLMPTGGSPISFVDNLDHDHLINTDQSPTQGHRHDVTVPIPERTMTTETIGSGVQAQSTICIPQYFKVVYIMRVY